MYHPAAIGQLLKCSAFYFVEDHAAEKRQLVNEIVSLKKMTDLRERDTARREVQVQQFRTEADKGLSALQDSECRMQTYRADVSVTY